MSCTLPPTRVRETSPPAREAPNSCTREAAWGTSRTCSVFFQESRSCAGLSNLPVTTHLTLATSSNSSRTFHDTETELTCSIFYRQAHLASRPERQPQDHVGKKSVQQFIFRQVLTLHLSIYFLSILSPPFFPSVAIM